jgi:hypothetical protein
MQARITIGRNTKEHAATLKKLGYEFTIVDIAGKKSILLDVNELVTMDKEHAVDISTPEAAKKAVDALVAAGNLWTYKCNFEIPGTPGTNETCRVQTAAFNGCQALRVLGMASCLVAKPLTEVKKAEPKVNPVDVLLGLAEGDTETSQE